MHDAPDSAPYGYIHRKDDYLRRLRRIEGQARGLQRMVEDEQYCIDVGRVRDLPWHRHRGRSHRGRRDAGRGGDSVFGRPRRCARIHGDG